MGGQPGDGRPDPGPRRGHRRAPEPSGPAAAPPGPPPGDRRRAAAAPPDGGGGLPGGRRRVADAPARPDPGRSARVDRPGVDRPGVDRPGVDDRYPPADADGPAPRRSRTAGIDLGDTPDRPGGRRRPDAPRRDPGRREPGHPAAGVGTADDDDRPSGPARGLVDGGRPVRDTARGSARADAPVAGRPTRGRRGPTRRDDVPTAARRRRWLWVVAAAVVVAVPVGLVVLDGPDDGSGASQAAGTVEIGRSADSDGSAPAPAGDPAATDAPAGPTATEVTFEVTGSGPVGAITYSRGAVVANVSGVELPWEKTVPAAAETVEYSISAAGATGEVSCRIVVDGVVLAEETDSEYSAVYCSARR
ncbi:MmpS family transport accessory protein [Pseudonocardia abyssalis]|uniref:MmpS family membrane protein n=1 Tax=Pseudonocardia abyssalis TaxID=2792008 RepID=A0ABS6USU5_9PSEU|nr:MmpS family transport accessory protein [Pseudonocardia abyssalis]MBW0119040.1 hypothetical protein [Pseudonocardia abyssalis]MBW0135320.1 hypothetical protein [Pseudonocardia abyssalis]